MKSIYFAEIMPVLCSVCSQAFLVQSQVDNHLANVHNMGGPKSHKCDMCAYVTQDVLDLNQHKIKSHFQTKLQQPF